MARTKLRNNFLQNKRRKIERFIQNKETFKKDQKEIL